jgi:cellulose synthase/poly-beta-1,6-N-acetylglucosamine synthase-like glycosyltransferase
MEDLPFVTIVIPIRNEGQYVKRSVGAVLAQDYPSGHVEVIVADGMSNDGTRKIVQSLKAKHSNLLLIDNPGKIVPTGLNAAIRKAKGEIIVRVDGHAIVPPNYIRQCVEWLMKTGVDCVGGAVESLGTGYTGNAIAVAMSSRFGVGNTSFRTAHVLAKPKLTDTVPFGAYRREVFEQIGFFNEDMVRHQDYEFNYRLRKAGGRILLIHWLKIKYYVRNDLKRLWRQFWQYGLWKGRFLRTYPKSLKFRHLFPPLFVSTLFLGALSTTISKVGIYALGLTLGAYAAFLLLSLITMSINGKLKYLPILPVVLACLHMSWGLGVWFGLLSPTKLKSSPENSHFLSEEAKAKQQEC